MSESDSPEIIKAAEALVEQRRDDFGDTLPWDLLEPMEQEYYLAQARIVAAIVRPASDGKTAGPPGSAQREARSEPQPVAGGGEELIAAAKAILEAEGKRGTGAFFEAVENHALTLARALLSSPRVEEVRREAFEEAAKVAEALAAELARLKGSGDRRVQIGSHLETCATIAADIRSLSPQGG